MQIGDRHVVSFHYTLMDDTGTVLDTSRSKEPLSYLHGAGNLVPGLERALAGRSAGDSFDVDIPAEQGYGQHDPSLVQTIPRSLFHGVDDVKPGMRFQAQGPQGQMNIIVTAVEGDRVTVDGNHPLAGKTLHYAIEVTDVRPASANELQPGQAS